jgi:hypothetical protein
VCQINKYIIDYFYLSIVFYNIYSIPFFTIRKKRFMTNNEKLIIKLVYNLFRNKKIYITKKMYLFYPSFPYIIILILLFIVYLLSSFFYFNCSDYLHSFLVFSYCNSRKYQKDDNDDDDDDLLFEPGLRSYSGEEYLFRYGGEYKELISIRDSGFVEKVKTFINSIELKDNYMYYVGIYSEKLENSDTKYGNILMSDYVNIYSILIRNKDDCDNINYKILEKKVKNNLYELINEYEDHDTILIPDKNNLYINIKEIDLSDKENVKWKFKALDLDKVNITNIEKTNVNKGLGKK